MLAETDVHTPLRPMDCESKVSPHHLVRGITDFWARRSSVFITSVHNPNGSRKTLCGTSFCCFSGPNVRVSLSILQRNAVCQARKRAQTQIFGSGHLLVGVFHVHGWGQKCSVCHSKPRETKLLGGISRDFGWDVPGSGVWRRVKSAGVRLQYLAAAITLETCLEHPFTQPVANKLLHSKQQK